MNSSRGPEDEPHDNCTYHYKTHHLKGDDMVWAKVKKHPCDWWPGMIPEDIFVSPVRLTKCIERWKPDSIPVLFFGDGTYGWFDPKDVRPFSSEAPRLSKVSSDETFQNAVTEAFYEASRRGALAVVCNCRNRSRFEPLVVEIPDYVHADVPAYAEEKSSVYSVQQIDEACRLFDPLKALDFVKNMAVGTREDEYFGGDVELFLKMKGMMSGYRSKVSEVFGTNFREVFSGDVGSEGGENQKTFMQRAIKGDEFSAELKTAETPISQNHIHLKWQPSSPPSNQSTPLLLQDLNCPSGPLPLDQPIASLFPKQLAASLRVLCPSYSSSPNQSMALLLEQSFAPSPLEQTATLLRLEQQTLVQLPPKQLVKLLPLEQSTIPVEQFIDQLKTELDNIRYQCNVYNLASRYNSLRPYDSHRTQNLAVLLKLIWNIYPHIPHLVLEPLPENWVHSFAHYLRHQPGPSPVRHKYNQKNFEPNISNDFFVVKLGGCKDRSISLIPLRYLMGQEAVLSEVSSDAKHINTINMPLFKKVAAGLNSLNITGNRLIEANDIIKLLHVEETSTAKPNKDIFEHITTYAEYLQPHTLWGQRIVKCVFGGVDKSRRRIFFQLTGSRLQTI